FYKELLHLIGLEEVKVGTKNIIRRKEKDKQAGSLIENAINILITEDSLHKLKDKTVFGLTRDEQLFGVALELSLTWINRILFLKLLEGQLITYHKGNKDYRFLNSEMIHDYDELYKLFHQVLAHNINERSSSIRKKYARVPYLNSSLFEISELEDATIKINSLDNSETVELIITTILKGDKKKSRYLPALEYLFKFLDAYDFASEGGEDIAEDNKTIINASVLGKVFEKINGYKDGSIFTPGFITMYMSRQALRLAVIQKFNEYFNSNKIAEVSTFEELYNRIDKIDIKTTNEIINALRICDPAVGSGHFLVSCLNEIIVIKSELGILIDKDGKRLRDYEIVVDNDELIISDDNGIFEYNYQNKESQRVQETIFNERQTIIENCLFGVDINPNSVKICRLRLWIELLKSSYYKAPDYTELETLPNIDINIKCGNSLVSRYALDADLKKALQKSKWNITSYRLAVMTYRNAGNKDEKRAMLKLIDEIKNNFEIEIQHTDKRFVKLHELKGKLFNLTNQVSLFDQTAKEKKAWEKKVAELTKAIQKQEQIIEDIKNSAIYKNAFEWRFEFPEVLNIDGEFEGFDVVIANPPYIQHRELAYLSSHLKSEYAVYSGTADISSYFFEKFTKVLKPKGIISVINSNKFFNAEYGRPLRKYLSNFPFISIINFEQVPIFYEVLVSSAIFTFTNITLSETFKYTKFFKEKVETLEDIEEIKKHSILMEQSSLKNDNWLFNDTKSNAIIAKVKANGIPIGKIADIKIKRGLTTGFDDAFLIDKDKYNFFTKNNEKSNAIIKKALKGEHINRYKINFKDLWLINSHNGIKEVSEPINVERDFPLIYEHFVTINLKTNGKVENRSDKGKHWTNLRSCAFINDFSKPKIIWGLISGNWDFAYDDEGYFLTSASFFLISNRINIKFILALLNSKLYQYFFIQVGEYTAGGAFVLKKTSIEKFIIPTLEESDQKPFIEKVDQILSAKKQGKDTTDLEQQIDRMVYELYDLTEEEIKIVEGEV
ncbi:MAG: TaqI-like C-terminal specificity domain-containing protein, partial [bacterium]